MKIYHALLALVMLVVLGIFSIANITAVAPLEDVDLNSLQQGTLEEKTPETPLEGRVELFLYDPTGRRLVQQLVTVEQLQVVLIQLQFLAEQENLTHLVGVFEWQDLKAMDTAQSFLRLMEAGIVEAQEEQMLVWGFFTPDQKEELFRLLKSPGVPIGFPRDENLPEHLPLPASRGS